MSAYRNLMAQAAAGALLLLLLAVPSQAAVILVSIDTTPLMTGVTGPYSIEFQLVDGDGLINNMVTIDTFTFGGGSASGAATVAGGVTGDLSSSVVMNDTSFFNTFYQPFVPGSLLTFQVTLTGVYVAPTPDAFSFAILNGSMWEVSTTGMANELVFVDLKTPPVISVYQGLAVGDDPVLGAPVADLQGVPEPTTGIICLLGLGLLALRPRRR
ncbi:NF038129 family PEP-CTERM protein [Paludibaculum fermentans]|uniref:NF038129 family PEP-CTERM protein n=1 Tax=Paludibaculum fermentans TaxID=1473598 RepID=UPI003EBD29E8